MITAIVWVLFSWGAVWSVAANLADEDKTFGGGGFWYASVVFGCAMAIVLTIVVNRG